MSEEKKVPNQVADPELDELLDSALKDFDKPAITKKEDESSPSAISSTEESNEEATTVEEVWTEDFIKQAADQFQRNLEELMQNGSNSELGDSFKKMAQTVAGALSDGTGEASTPNFQSAISQALKDLSATSENLGNVPNITESDLAAMFGQTSLEEGGTDLLPFMQGMMQSLLSKDVLYPSLKDIIDKYPAWLDEKKSTLSPADFTRYEKQFELMQNVCKELEEEKEDDSEEVKRQRFEKTLSLMQEMQAYGQPPDDLVGDQQPLFQLDAEGNPLGTPALPGSDESNNCSVM
ncbi:peroxisomal biogenesis factor 19 [Copidosoma floridanum]|uniref:peroxisomal biogenesis factor 19 n=1 Tax=Copidosoma floridanum TaxID=29053 RepID=UPI0006C9C830|nr:peroxisomal biogenesis factor 19 [Copidosoma floridanum]